MTGPSARFFATAGLSTVSGLLCLLTLFWKDWIEAITGLDPDHHNGFLEWAIVAALLVVTLVLTQATRTEWRVQQRVRDRSREQARASTSLPVRQAR